MDDKFFFIMYVIIIALVIVLILSRTVARKNDVKVTSDAKEFDKYYKDPQELKEIDIKNNGLKPNSYALLIVISILLLILIIRALYNGHTQQLIPFAIIGPIIIIACIILKEYDELNKIYKKTILKNMLNDHFKGSEFFPERGIGQGEFPFKRYFNYYNIFRSQDLLILPYKDKKITLSEVKLIKESTDSEGRTTRTTVFSGIVGYCEVIENKLTFDLYIGDGVTLDKSIKMDNDEFAKKFNVISKEEINVYKILTPANMEKILKIAEEIPTLNLLIDKSFIPNRLYFSFWHDDLFEYVKSKEENSKALAYTHDLLEKIIKMCEVIEDEINDKLV